MKKLFTLFAVAVMAFAAQANVLTVAEGTQSNAHYPMYGLYCDTEGTISQVIYPADMLTDMVGKQITEIKFLTTQAISYKLDGCMMNFSLKVVQESEFPTSAVFDLGAEDICGTATPVTGETQLVFTLNEPFLYEGGNLLIGTDVIEPSGYATTYFYGIDTGLYCACYQYTTASGYVNCYREAFLPQATFTYEDVEEPTEQCLAPNSSYAITGTEIATVTIVNREEGATINYEVYCDGVLLETGSFTGDEYSFDVVGAGSYVIHAIATKQGKRDSFDGGVFFTILEGEGLTGIDEMSNGKTIASIRYFNAAGQEMQSANGMTIVVTTYTDGTSSTAKVMK